MAGEARRACATCGRCWALPALAPVDTLACPGCRRRGLCESRPTWLATELSSEEILGDGTRVLVRPLLYGDRFELATAFLQLSDRSRRLRFFAPPLELDVDDLDYLTNLDYEDHFALGVFALDEVGQPGVAVGRFIRDPQQRDEAEVAITVVDRFQRRGLGTLLSRRLAHFAIERGVRTFVSYVLWENDDMLDLLRGEGARVLPDEPGVAKLELDLPEQASQLPEPFLHRVLRALAEPVLEVLGLDDGEGTLPSSPSTRSAPDGSEGSYERDNKEDIDGHLTHRPPSHRAARRARPRHQRHEP